jgi:hypothetical protein
MTKSIETEVAQDIDKNIRTLRDDELDLVCGGQKGSKDPPIEFLKITMKQVVVTHL